MRALAIAAALCACAARANPIDTFGLGSRAAAMGSAGTALGGDSSSTYYNPGALLDAQTLRLDVGYRYARPHLRLDGAAFDADASQAILFGITAPGRIGPLRVAFGLSLAVPPEGLVAVKTRPFDSPRFPSYENRLHRLYGAFDAAVEIVPGLSIGAGLTFLSRTEGGVALEGVVGVTNAETSTLTSSIDTRLVAVRYPQAGVHWKAWDGLSLGLTYRGSYTLRLDTALRIDGNLQDPGYPPLVQNGYFAVQTHVVEMFQPMQLALGAALRVSPTVLIAADLTYARWSEMPAPKPLTYTLDVGVFNPLIKIEPPRVYPDPGFKDVLVPRAGLEWRAHDANGLALDVRGGGSFEASPVPEQRGESSFADGHKATATAGLGVEAQRPWGLLAGSAAIDLNLGATWMLPRAHARDDASRPGFRATGLVWQAGSTVRLKF